MHSIELTTTPKKGTNKVLLILGIVIALLPFIVLGVPKLLAHDYDWEHFKVPFITIPIDRNAATAIQVFAFLGGIILYFAARVKGNGTGQTVQTQKLTIREEKVKRMLTKWRRKDTPAQEYKRKYNEEKKPWRDDNPFSRTEVAEMNNRLGWNAPLEFIREF